MTNRLTVAKIHRKRLEYSPFKISHNKEKFIILPHLNPLYLAASRYWTVNLIRSNSSQKAWVWSIERIFSAFISGLLTNSMHVILCEKSYKASCIIILNPTQLLNFDKNIKIAYHLQSIQPGSMISWNIKNVHAYHSGRKKEKRDGQLSSRRKIKGKCGQKRINEERENPFCAMCTHRYAFNLSWNGQMWHFCNFRCNLGI